MVRWLPELVGVHRAGSTSMSLHLGEHDGQDRWLRSTSRIGGAICPSERIPVATWYSSGWKR